MGDSTIRPSMRITAKGYGRSASEWLRILGYDYEEVREYVHNNKMSMREVVPKLISFAYDGGECTYPFKNHRRPNDCTGMRFGRLVAEKKVDRQTYLCRCDCGNIREAERGELLIGEVRSCGCLRREYQTVYLHSQENGKPQECRRLVYKGRNLSITEWSKQPELIEKGIKRRNIYTRLRAGWSIERTLTEPAHKRP